MIKSKKQMITIIVSFILMIFLGTTTYAFFNYTRTGVSNTIRVGRISFVSRQQQTITLTDLFPIDPEETGIMDDNTKVGTLEIEIEGDTDYVDGVEYLISVTNAQIYTGGKTIPISINVTVEDLGDESSTYFTSRNSKDTNIYKRLSGDVISGDQMLLVGYIKPNTISGEAEGVNGSITIKAYLDGNNIAITDTPEENSEWQNGRTVVSTEEWNAIKTTGISFQVKVEANEGIWVDEPIYNKLRTIAVMDNISSTNVSSSTGIDFSKVSGDTDNDNVLDNGQGLYIKSGTENDAYPVVYYRGMVDNNVFFANKCWQIVRTTETGGTKMIYNGENTGTENEPACEPVDGYDRQITLNIDNTDINAFSFSTPNMNDSPAYNGYTYASQIISLANDNYSTGSKFGNGVTWDGTNYTLTDVSDTLNAYHHYTCGTTGETTCSSIRYYYTYFTLGTSDYYLYFTFTNGKKIDDILTGSIGTNNSNAKEMIDEWYEGEINNTPYASKIENTVYCNDRNIVDLGGMNPNGGSLSNTNSTYSMFAGFRRNISVHNPSTKCLSVQDAYTKGNSNGNGLLDYSVGMITADEVALAGAVSGIPNANYYLYTGVNYWTMTPFWFIYRFGYAFEFIVKNDGSMDAYNVGENFYGLRPVISLNSSSSIASGEGTPTDPYIIK